MRCSKCGSSIDDHVFPGAAVHCARCGALALIDASAQSTSGSPYRERASVDTPSPPSSRRRGPPFLCPRCTRALEDVDGPDLVCCACHGAFVGHAELAARIAATRPTLPPPVRPRHAASPPPEPIVRYVRCPKCGDLMTRFNFSERSGIVLDACRIHGTWFDRGELESTLDFVRAGGIEEEAKADPPPPPKGDDPPATRAREAELRADAMKEASQVRRAAQIANDLLAVLFRVSNRP